MAVETGENLQKIMKPGVERNILSICLKNPSKIIDVQGHEIKAEHFLVEVNRYIYMAIDYLFTKRQSPTPFAIVEVLQNNQAKKLLEDFGGIEYLTVLSESTIDENTLDIFCDKLKQSYTRTELYKICEQTQNFIFSEKMEVLNPTEIIEEHTKKICNLESTMASTSEVYKMGENTERVLAERAEHPNEVPGLEMGWTKFDYYTNGGQPGDLIMLCARPKTGKSTILTNWATKIGIIDKVPVLYFDTEMNEREQEDRILSILTGIPHKEIVSGMYVLDTEFGTKEEKMAKMKIAVQQLKDGAYYHIYMPNFTVEKVNAISNKFKTQYNVQAIFFDYLKFPSSQVASLKAVAEWQMLGYIASGLKDMAGKLKVPVYAGCQESRGGDVGGSDRILQLASKLMFLNNKTEEQIMKEGNLNGNQTLNIAYQRNGESNCPPINIQFDRSILRQREV